METQRTLAVTKLPNSPRAALERTDVVLDKMTNSPVYSAASALLATLKTDRDALAKAQTAKNEGGGRAATSVRDEALKTVKIDLQKILLFVQGLADTSPSQAASIIEGAGFRVRVVTVRHKPDLEIVQGPTPGTVVARAKARGPRTTYWFQFSTDQKTWSTTPPTRKSSTVISGLTPVSTYYFRYQALTDTLSDWSQVVSFIVK
jgi:hypothetical protein